MNKKILIADDSENTRKLIHFVLQREGYDVTDVSNGAAALEKIEKEHFDLVILDISMPEVDGFSVTLQMRKTEKTKSIPILISTAHIRLRELFMLHAIAKFDDFLEKPFHASLLREKVNKLISGGKSVSEHTEDVNKDGK